MNRCYNEEDRPLPKQAMNVEFRLFCDTFACYNTAKTTVRHNENGIIEIAGLCERCAVLYARGKR